MSGDADTLTPEQEVAAFADGFDNDATPTETPASVGSETTETPAVEYAQLTKAEYEELKARAALVEDLKATADRSFGTAFGKIGGIERQLKDLTSGAQVEISQEDIDTLRGDGFEPLAVALEKVRSMRGLPGGVDQAKLDELVQQRIAPALEGIGTKVDQAVEARLLKRAHPDWQQVTATPEFNAYAASLPNAVQAELANSWDADFIGEHLTKFKQSRKPAAPAADDASARRSRMSAAVTPRGAGGHAAPSQVDDLMAGFNE